MDIMIGKLTKTWPLSGALLVLTALALVIFRSEYPPIAVSANSIPTFGPACGKASIDGVVNTAEWSHASAQTFQMIPGGSADPLTATLHVMNSANDLYLGITINDDEFSTYAEFLPQGDGFRIDFDNDHGGTLFEIGDEVLIINAGSPQFRDSFISGGQSAPLDTANGGTSDGFGVASRVSGLNHFELKHPLCSGDSLDYCLVPTDLVGFRLEYLDAEADGSFGGSWFFPGKTDTSEADIVIGTCSFVYLPLIRK